MGVLHGVVWFDTSLVLRPGLWVLKIRSEKVWQEIAGRWFLLHFGKEGWKPLVWPINTLQSTVYVLRTATSEDMDGRWIWVFPAHCKVGTCVPHYTVSHCPCAANYHRYNSGLVFKCIPYTANVILVHFKKSVLLHLLLFSLALNSNCGHGVYKMENNVCLSWDRLLHAAFLFGMLVTLTMEATCCCETSVAFEQTTPHGLIMVAWGNSSYTRNHTQYINALLCTVYKLHLK